MIIVTAPSGSGKTTLVRHLLSKIDDLCFSVSATTRKRRHYEVDGKDYYFLSKEDFEAKMESKELLEYEEVYEGQFYGTLVSEVERIWKVDKSIIFDIDVHGAVRLKRKFPNNSLAVFVRPPSMEELRNRLISRNTEDVESLNKRLERAEHELTFENRFDVTVINDDLDVAKKQVVELVTTFLNNSEAFS